MHTPDVEKLFADNLKSRARNQPFILPSRLHEVTGGPYRSPALTSRVSADAAVLKASPAPRVGRGAEVVALDGSNVTAVANCGSI